MISASIQAKKGWLYAVLQFKTKEGRYKQRWVAMHLKATAKKKEQEERLTQIRLEYSGVCSVEALEISFADYEQSAETIADIVLRKEMAKEKIKSHGKQLCDYFIYIIYSMIILKYINKAEMKNLGCVY